MNLPAHQKAGGETLGTPTHQPKENINWVYSHQEHDMWKIITCAILSRRWMGRYIVNESKVEGRII